MRSRTYIALFLAVVLTSISATLTPLATASVMQQPPTTTPMLPGTTIPINATSGNQTNPSVACNIASFTNDDFEGNSTIRYFDFATNTEHVVPGDSLDRLSDTDGQRIAFTQFDATGDHINIYDIASQANAQIPGAWNSDPVLGGSLVAFVHSDHTDANTSEISVYDRTTGVTTQLTNDAVQDWQPAISPDGQVVVWKKCDNTGCDIYSATQTGPGAFMTRLVSSDGTNDSPDTNGQVIVYTSTKGGDNDIYVQPVSGSNEMHLSLPGDQRDVRISRNLLVFESQVSDGSYDVFVYDLSTARLFQVTNTPGVSETLSDIVAGCNGLNRIVYSIPGGGDFDVYSFTFELNDSVVDQLNDLIALVQSFNLPDGTEASLITKLQDALTAVNASNTPTACDALTSFINASQAQSGKKLTADQMKQLVDSATQVKSDLGCQ